MASMLMKSGCKLLIEIYFYYFKNTPKSPEAILFEPPLETGTTKVFGGLVWILVASTHIDPVNPLGWVMFVSVFCFVMTFLWMIMFATGCHKSSSVWAAAVRAQHNDFVYHGLAVIFYLSAGVELAYITLMRKSLLPFDLRLYQIDIAAVVFAFATTLLYFIHAILSAIRWKHF
ncbi:hypothetical protein CCH79_00015797 [Gambusia affinis]|uniref:MARVEL domain-containing protein n=1 Tax=Gambusia affinis TaxID=33528 RepID=A0A315UPA3_GAMAF|nr:hypothetical protein CCH79_00015797 [Gambusia affinis]